MRKFTIPSFIRNSVESFTDHTAMAFVDEEGISYSELGKRIENTMTLLDILGIERGDKVALI